MRTWFWTSIKCPYQRNPVDGVFVLSGLVKKYRVGWGGPWVFYTPHFQMLRPAHPPVLFDQSLIAHTYFCSGDVKQMICCSLFSSPSSISSSSVALPSTQLGEVSERIRAWLWSVFLKKCPFQFYQSWSERHLCTITSDEQISSPRLVCKQNSVSLHSLCVDILFNTLPREITDVTSDVSTCKGYPWVSKLLLPPQRRSLGIPMKKTTIEK